MNPLFVSVTYGPGGYNRERALSIANYITNLRLCALSHLTVVGYQKGDIHELLHQLFYLGVRNILALRGDVPANLTFPDHLSDQFHYAFDLTSFIKQDGRFCIAGAAYPEGYSDTADVDLSVKYLKKKADSGADFFITQLFFDNTKYYRFIEKAQAIGVTQPIIPAILPILKSTNLKRILQLSAIQLPAKLQSILEKYPEKSDDLEKAGINYAVQQMDDLYSSGVNHIHLYSMNKVKQAIEIFSNLKILKKQSEGDRE